jgi:hypothetical protein
MAIRLEGGGAELGEKRGKINDAAGLLEEPGM